MSVAFAIVLVAAVMVLGGATILAVQRLQSARTIDASAGAGGVKLSVTAQTNPDDRGTIVALARQVGELDERVQRLELERAADKLEIRELTDKLLRTRAELADTQRRLTHAVSRRDQLMGRIRELEAHVARLEAQLAAAQAPGV